MYASRLVYLRSAFVLQSQNDIAPTGTLRYKSRPFPEKGEGLVLERTASLEKTSRLSMRQPKEYASELPSQTSSGPMDEDMMEDVFKLVEALETGFLDVQTDAATAIAALTSDGETISPQPWSFQIHLMANLLIELVHSS